MCGLPRLAWASRWSLRSRYRSAGVILVILSIRDDLYERTLRWDRYFMDAPQVYMAWARFQWAEASEAYVELDENFRLFLSRVIDSCRGGDCITLLEVGCSLGRDGVGASRDQASFVGGLALPDGGAMGEEFLAASAQVTEGMAETASAQVVKKFASTATTNSEVVGEFS
jgi:hypothetical protein